MAAWAVLLVALLSAPVVLGEGYELHLLIVSAIFVMLSSGLSLIVGHAGLLSLGHAAFFGLGAYTSALLYLRLGVPMWGGLPAAALVSGGAAYLIGLLVLKVRGHRFIITTIAFAEIARLVAVNTVDLTRGQMGLAGIQAPTITVPGLGTLDFGAKTEFYYLTLAFAAICVWTVARIVRSPIGWGLAAVRENENLGESVGVSAYRHSMIAFLVGGAFAGIAGSLHAHYMNFVSPDLFLFSYTTTMLVMVVIGGRTTIAGPVIGAVVFTFLPEYLRFVHQYRLIVLGAILLITVMLCPGGFVELWERWRRRAAVPAVGAS
ncbi:MAG TPA: branched-chain amino acid ABC transporter permease [Alphaproteobacteria bacterium]